MEGIIRALFLAPLSLWMRGDPPSKEWGIYRSFKNKRVLYNG